MVWCVLTMHVNVTSSSGFIPPDCSAGWKCVVFVYFQFNSRTLSSSHKGQFHHGNPITMHVNVTRSSGFIPTDCSAGWMVWWLLTMHIICMLIRVVLVSYLRNGWCLLVPMNLKQRWLLAFKETNQICIRCCVEGKICRKCALCLV